MEKTENKDETIEKTEEEEIPEETVETAKENEKEEKNAEEKELEETFEEEEAIEKETKEAESEEAAEEVSLRRREEIPEEEIVEERMYTIPLREAWRTPRKNRVPRAIRLIRNFIQRHMKVGLRTGLEDEEEEEETGRVIISNEVNAWVWRRGIEKPPRKVRVRAVKDRDGNVTVYLAEGD